MQVVGCSLASSGFRSWNALPDLNSPIHRSAETKLLHVLRRRERDKTTRGRDREALSAGSNVESDESAGFPDARAVLGAVEREDYLRDDKHNGHSILPRKGTGNWLFARIQGQEKDR